MNQLRVLFTNTAFALRSGSGLFIQELALELSRRGHLPFVYSPRLGPLAEVTRAAGITVVDDLRQVAASPTLIHGQHHLETMTALSHFPDAPAILFCHGILPWEETPIRHPRILRYAVVSEAIRDHAVRQHGIDASLIELFPNFVDLRRFKPRATPLPRRPQKALIFSNNATEDNYGGILRQACAMHGIALETVGYGYATATDAPEAILGDYDIVFARGRAALESLAVGAAVICCDIGGAASLVTSGNLEWFRRLNFGLLTQTHPITVDYISGEIAQFDAREAAKVSAIVRASVSLESSTDRLLTIYQEIIHEWAEKPQTRGRSEAEGTAVAEYLRFISRSASASMMRQEVTRLSQASHSLRLQRDQLAAHVAELENELAVLRHMGSGASDNSRASTARLLHRAYNWLLRRLSSS